MNSPNNVFAYANQFLLKSAGLSLIKDSYENPVFA